MNRIALALCVLLGTASAQITFTSSGYLTGNGSSGTVSGDFNLDGLPDLAVASFDDNKVTILTNMGSGSFSQTASYPVAGAGWIKTADVNRDGNLDLLVGSGVRGSSGGGTTSNGVVVLLNNGDGTFRYGQTLTTARYPMDFDVQNFDSDGYPDLLVKQCDYTMLNALCEIDYYRNASGTYQLGTVLVAPTSYFGMYIGAGNTVHFADLNGDGNMDAMYTTKTSLVTRFGNGSGSFTATYRVGGITGGFVVSKFNNSIAAPDVAALSPAPCPSGPPCQSYVDVWSNNGKGVLSRTAHTLGWGDFIQAADVDGDGNMDVLTLVGSTSFGRIDYFLGTGAGSLFGDTEVPNQFPYTAEQPIARDFRLNGRHDITYAEFVSNGDSVLLNNNAAIICAPPNSSKVQAKICVPRNGQHIASPGTLAMKVSGNSPAGLLRLEIWIDGKKVRESRSDQIFFVTSVPQGTHTVTAVAVDLFGGVGKHSVEVSYP